MSGPRPNRIRARPSGRDVEICSDLDCDDVAHARGLCPKHYRELLDSRGPRDDYPLRIGVAYDLSPQELEELRRQVEADALPLFVLAMNWCLAQALVKALGPDPKRVS